MDSTAEGLQHRDSLPNHAADTLSLHQQAEGNGSVGCSHCYRASGIAATQPASCAMPLLTTPLFKTLMLGKKAN